MFEPQELSLIPKQFLPISPTMNLLAEFLPSLASDYAAHLIIILAL